MGGQEKTKEKKRNLGHHVECRNGGGKKEKVQEYPFEAAKILLRSRKNLDNF
jgi:hypothetical protein